MSYVETVRSDQNTLDGERIAALMWRAKLNRRRLGLAIGVDPSSIGQKLSGKRPWYVHEAVALATVLQTTVAYLTGESSDDSPIQSGVLVNELDWAEYKLWRLQQRPQQSPSVGRMGLEPMTDGL